MLIVMENKAYSSAQGSPYIIGASQAPYINNTLVKNYTSATHWFAVEHNSPLDYYDLVSGSNQSSATKPYIAKTLVDELNTAKIPWKAYMESMPSNCYTGGSIGLYSSIHNPFAPFSDYKTLCNGTNGVVPYNAPFSSSQLKTDLNSATPPAFVWFTPNICNDMHSHVTPCGTNAVVNGDMWLSTFIPAIQGTSWYTSGGIIIITWDESIGTDTSGGTFGTGGHIATLVISHNPKGAFTPSGDHYAVLRGIEEEYGVGLLGNSANSSFGDLKPAF
jgi:acid phosphatase